MVRQICKVVFLKERLLNLKEETITVLGKSYENQDDKKLYIYERAYNYKVPEKITDLKVGNYVLLPELQQTGKYQLAVVVDVFEDTFDNRVEVNKASKFILAKVDLEPIFYEDTKRQRKIYLANKIEEMKREFEEQKLLQLIASSNPEAAKLIEEYKTL